MVANNVQESPYRSGRPRREEQTRRKDEIRFVRGCLVGC